MRIRGTQSSLYCDKPGRQARQELGDFCGQSDFLDKGEMMRFIDQGRGPLSFQSFNKIYQDVVLDVYKYWTPQMQVEIAAHNYGWNPGLLDVKIYLQASSVRFYKAYQSFVGRGDVQTVCDVGGFWGVFSITLKELGYDVSMTESLQYYSDSFSE